MSPPTLEQIFESHFQALSLMRCRGTVAVYRGVARRFLDYLHATFPQVRRLSQLHRDPHLLGWFCWLSEHQPPLCNSTRTNYLAALHSLFDDLIADGHPLQPDLIRSQDYPPPVRYLPRPWSQQDDQRIQQELRHTDDLPANALLLTRATGMRIGECIRLPLDCLRQIGPDQWALHVPLGKLHTERLVPIDVNTRRLVDRILSLRSLAPSTHLANSEGFLLPRSGGHYSLYKTLCWTLAAAAKRAGCSGRANPHRLRHNFATEMLRLGVSLPALMQLLGHKDIRMTLRYVQVTQEDLQREFHLARQNAAQSYRLPVPTLPQATPISDLPGIRQALTATRHLIEMYRRQFSDDNIRRKLQRLDHRLLNVEYELVNIPTAGK